MAEHFADRLNQAIQTKGTPVCVGLDPRLAQIPEFIKKRALLDNEKSPMVSAAEAILVFNKGIIDAVADIVPVVKVQVAFYELFGAAGMQAFAETLKYAKAKGLLTIADVKRNDIGSTAEAYAQAYLGEVSMLGEQEVIMPVFDVDSITVTPYLGWDGIKPFMDECRKYGRGLFVLLKTSNPSSGDLQDLCLQDGSTVYETMGQYIESWGAADVGDSGYSFLGAVVGATHPAQAKRLRELMPETIFLVPGYGAQGGTAEDVRVCFNKDGLGAIVNNSRGIIFAYEHMPKYGEKGYAEAARVACEAMKEDLMRR